MSRPQTVELLMHHAALSEGTGLARYALSLSRALRSLGRDDLRYRATAMHPTRDEPDVEAADAPRWRRLMWLAVGTPPYRTLPGTDLIHLLAPTHPIPSQLPLILTVHDVLPLLHPEWYGRSQVLALRRVLRWSRSHATRWIAVSEWSARTLVEEVGISHINISVIGEGVAPRARSAPDALVRESTLARYGLTQDFLLCVGVVRKQKNLDVLAPAVAAAGLPLVVVGRGSENAAAEAPLLSRLAAKGLVRFTGHVSDAELDILMHEARALLQPSYLEGYGLPILEAMSVGTPVISSTGGALPEVVGDAGVLVPPEDVEGWRAAVQRLMADPDGSAELAARGRSRAAARSWTQVATDTAELHLQALGSSVVRGPGRAS